MGFMSTMPIGDMSAMFGGPQMYGGPAEQPILGGIAGQTQDQIANPIYGGSSPFQPPQAVGGPAPIDNNMGAISSGGKGMGMLPFIPGPMGEAAMQGIGQLTGGPAGQPILGGTPMQGGNPLAGFGASNSQFMSPAPMTAQSTRASVPQSTYGRVSNNKPSQPLYRGGLRQPPNNYRPPMYSNPRRFLGR